MRAGIGPCETTVYLLVLLLLLVQVAQDTVAMLTGIWPG